MNQIKLKFPATIGQLIDQQQITYPVHPAFYNGRFSGYQQPLQFYPHQLQRQCADLHSNGRVQQFCQPQLHYNFQRGYHPYASQFVNHPLQGNYMPAHNSLLTSIKLN